MQLRFASRAFLIGQRFLWFIWNWNCSNWNGLTTRLYCGTFCMRKWIELFSAQLRIVDIPTRIHMLYRMCAHTFTNGCVAHCVQINLCQFAYVVDTRRCSWHKFIYINRYKYIYVYSCMTTTNGKSLWHNWISGSSRLICICLSRERESQTQSAE